VNARTGPALLGCQAGAARFLRAVLSMRAPTMIAAITSRIPKTSASLKRGLTSKETGHEKPQPWATRRAPASAAWYIDSPHAISATPAVRKEVIVMILHPRFTGTTTEGSKGVATHYLSLTCRWSSPLAGPPAPVLLSGWKGFVEVHGVSRVDIHPDLARVPMTEGRGPPAELRAQWFATRIFSIACGATLLAGLLILWFGARGFFSNALAFSCPPTGCHFPPPVEILTFPVAVVLGICAAVPVLVGVVPRLYLAGIGAGVLAMAMWWYIEDQLAPIHPPYPTVAGWQWPVGIAAVLLGGVFATLAGAYLGIMLALGKDESRRPRAS
jgi:hypothetical protein